MLKRHDSDCVLDTENDSEDEIETLEPEDADVFSPRAHQAGFWN